MPALKCRGYTLVELAVALALLGLIAAVIQRVLVGAHRTAHAQAEWTELQRNLRTAAAVLPAEFRRLAATEGDIYAMSAGEIRLRGLRSLRVICREPPLGGPVTGLPVTVFRDAFGGTPIEPRDSILLFYEGDEGTRSDDSWVSGVVMSVTAAPCPNGSPGDALAVNLSLPTTTQRNRSRAIPSGGPLFTFQPVRYASYRAGDGLWYLGIEVPGTSIQPLSGPLSGSGGLELRYQNATGGRAAVPESVALIEIRVRGRTAVPIRDAWGRPGIATDSVVTRVALRNNRRF